MENALIYISGQTLSCEVCHPSLVTAAVPSSFNQSYHLLQLKNNSGLMIPSEGTVKLVRAAERVIRQNSAEQGVSMSFVNHFVWAEIGLEDVF